MLRKYKVYTLFVIDALAMTATKRTLCSLKLDRGDARRASLHRRFSVQPP